MVEIIDKLHIIGKEEVLIVKKDNYKINDIINNEYIITGIEYSLHSPIVGLIVRKISNELDGSQ